MGAAAGPPQRARVVFSAGAFLHASGGSEPGSVWARSSQLHSTRPAMNTSDVLFCLSPYAAHVATSTLAAQATAELPAAANVPRYIKWVPAKDNAPMTTTNWSRLLYVRDAAGETVAASSSSSDDDDDDDGDDADAAPANGARAFLSSAVPRFRGGGGGDDVDHGASSASSDDSDSTASEAGGLDWGRREDFVLEGMMARALGPARAALADAAAALGTTAEDCQERWDSLLAFQRSAGADGALPSPPSSSSPNPFDMGGYGDDLLAASDTFRKIYCRRCHLFDCRLHGCDQASRCSLRIAPLISRRSHFPPRSRQTLANNFLPVLICANRPHLQCKTSWIDFQPTPLIHSCSESAGSSPPAQACERAGGGG